MKIIQGHKKLFILLSLFIFLFLLSFNLAKAGINDPIEFKAQTTIPGVFTKNTKLVLEKDDTTYIAVMIKGLYDYGIGIAGILAAIMLMAGGLVWLTSAGSSDKISQAKKLMSGSIIGLTLLFTSWIMLRTINPELVDFKIRGINKIKPAIIICCEYDGKAQTMYSQSCIERKGRIYEYEGKGIYIPTNNKCKMFSVACNIRTDCNNKVLWCLDSDIKITTKERCGGNFKERYIQKDGRCNFLAECAGKVASCMNQKEGSECRKTDSGESVDGYCYYSMCYVGDGREMESCGTKPGAFCYSKLCSGLGQVGENYYGDNTGGRRCSTSLYCCYKDVK